MFFLSVVKSELCGCKFSYRMALAKEFVAHAKLACTWTSLHSRILLLSCYPRNPGKRLVMAGEHWSTVGLAWKTRPKSILPSQ